MTQTIPATIKPGMEVVDRNLHKIGTVESFRATDIAPDGSEMASGVSPALERDENALSELLADLFHPDDGLPRELQEKLLREGYVRLDADGIFAADRYVLPGQIDRIEADRVVLSVEKKALLKA